MSYSCEGNELQNTLTYNTITILILILEVFWSLQCFSRQYFNSNQKPKLSNSIFYSALIVGELINVGFQSVYFFFNVQNSKRSIISMYGGCFQYILIFVVPNACIWYTVCFFIIVFSFPLKIKKYKIALIIIICIIVLFATSISVSRVVVQQLIDDNQTQALLDTAKLLRNIATIEEYSFCSLTFIICIVFFIKYISIHQHKVRIGLVSTSDKNSFNSIVHLVITATICEISDLISLITGDFLTSEQQSCQWGIIVLNWILGLVYSCSINLAFTPISCTKKTKQMDEESESFLSSKQ
ncbi:Conserved_hypothetical protein [Hexamita inflata]|uniref:Uncharacterized protein n=1 Tax=Hexamita inflata TaxID=28002 RepID=A0AA86P4C4_9EUKA|nr:Conserved hypothetical protein [Hexamita inflata]